jgi:phage-related protein
MRCVSRSLFRILNSEKIAPVQFLDLQLPGSTAASTLRFTDFGQPITWAGSAYVPISLSRGGIEEILSSEQGESPQSTLTVSNIDLQMADLLNRVELVGAYATLWLADRRLLSRQRDAMALAIGEVRDPQLSGSTLVFQILNAIGIAEKLSVPRRIYQAECNYAFGSSSCRLNLDLSPYSITATVQGSTTASYVDLPLSILDEAGDPDDPTDYWALGYILVASGACATQARPISQVEQASGCLRFILRHPFYTPPAAGDAVIVRRGCRKTKADCIARNNLANYGGFDEVPPVLFDPVEVAG